MPVDLDKARANLPLPELLERLGHGGAAKTSARCPLHDDKTASFSVFQGTNGRWKWKCHATCGGGDEIDLIAKLEGIDNATALKRYGELAGANGSNGVVVKWTRIGDPVSDALKIFGGAVVKSEPAKLEPLTEKVAARLADWRKYSPEFVKEISAAGIIGLYEAREGKLIAFPVAGGVHYRKADGSWRYSEGASASLFMPWPIDPNGAAHCHESQWCALAYADITKERNVIATRGASNIAPLAEALAGHMGIIYLFPQNDAPGQKWAESIREALSDANIKLCVVPKEHKDLNDMLRAKGKSCELEVDMAITKAEDFPAAAQRDQPAEGCEAPACAKPSDNVTECNGAVRSQDAGGGEPFGGDGEQALAPTPATPSTCESSASPANLSSLGDILDAIETYLKRYVIFPHAEQATVIALWAAHAWVYSAFRFTPYLNILSPEKRCGKTRLLECVELLVPRARKSGGISAAALRRRIDSEKPTLLLDEIDAVFGTAKSEANESLRGALDFGYQAGGVYTCCDGAKNEVKDFNVFCPKVIAGIGKNLPDTVTDRSIQIRLMRQTNDLKAVRFRQTIAEGESLPIRSLLAAWAKSAIEELSDVTPELPQALSDRQADMSECLCAIADMAGGEWPEKGRAAIIALCSVSEDQSPGVMLLGCIREVFYAKDTEAIVSADLVNALIAVEEANAPWVGWWEADIKRGQPHGPQQKLARMLEPYGIKPQKMGDDFDEGVKGYHRADFEDAWRRYLQPVKGLVTMEMPF